MGNVNIILAENILKYRRRSGLTQEALARALGVTFQAVSKWETGKSAPDISFLPTMADMFECTIDELFSRENKGKTGANCELYTELPWEDDDTIRVFETLGTRILKCSDRAGYIEVTFPCSSNEEQIQYFKVEVLGNIVSNGTINGGVICHGNIECHNIIGDVTCGGDVSACHINAFGKIICNKMVKK